MANVFPKGCRFFPVPSDFVESGGLRDLKPSALKLYTLLLYLAQKHTAVQVEMSNDEIKLHAGLDSKSIQEAREQLKALGLIRLTKGALGIYTYIVLDPVTFEAIPPPQGRRGVRRYIPKTVVNSNLEKALPPRPSRTAVQRNKKSVLPRKTYALCYTCGNDSDFEKRPDGSEVCVVCMKRSPARCSSTPITAKEIGF